VDLGRQGAGGVQAVRRTPDRHRETHAGHEEDPGLASSRTATALAGVPLQEKNWLLHERRRLWSMNGCGPKIYLADGMFVALSRSRLFPFVGFVAAGITGVL
jgi:hypothetical protein